MGLNYAPAIERLRNVCERWIYSSALVFALIPDEQQHSGFNYQYSVFQLELSRNLLFKRGNLTLKFYDKGGVRPAYRCGGPPLVYSRRHHAEPLRGRHHVCLSRAAKQGYQAGDSVSRSTPEKFGPLDKHYLTLREKMHRTFEVIGLAA